MPIYEYQGQQYEFPEGTSDADAFDFLGQQDSPAVSAGKDLAKTVPSALARGVAMIPAVVGDTGKLMRMGARKIGIGPDSDDYVEGTGKYALKSDALAPTSNETISAVEKATGPLYQPKGRAAKFLNSAVEMVPGAIAGPGGVLRNAIRFGAVPGVVAEGAGQLAEGTGYEPWARAIGGLFGLGAGALASRPNTANQALREGLGNVTEPQINAAHQLMEDAQLQGIALTWPEAIQQVTNSGTNLGNLQRVAEASQEGGAVLRPVMAQRAGQTQAAFDRNMDNITTQRIEPSQIGPRASDAASEVIEETREGINTQTRPLYEAARPQQQTVMGRVTMTQGDQVGPRIMQRLHRQPGFSDALQTVRENPHLSRHIEGLADENVLVLNEVQKLLEQQAQNVAAVTNTNRNVQVAASQGQTAGVTRRAMRRASRSVRRALDEQARLRERDLRPLQTGQVGRISAAPDTRSAGRQLLPERPLAGTEGETARTMTQLQGVDAPVARNLLRSRLEDGFAQGARDLQNAPNEFGAANARKILHGDRQLRLNVRAAMEQLPNGNAVANGFERLMEIFQATGRRQHIGSQTEFNRLVTERMRSGGVLGEAASSTSRANPFGYLRKRYEQWRLGRNLGELAGIMIDPGMRRRLIELSGANPGTPQYRTLMIQMATQMAGDDGEKQ